MLPLYFREISNYTNGKKDGQTIYFHKRDTTGSPPPKTWTDTLKIIPYQDGKINGWVHNWEKDGTFKDSVFYKNDEEVK